MFKTNEYFDGKVKSIAFESNKGTATVGVMAKGEYEFGTTTKEYMTVTAGTLTVLLPGKKEWETYNAGETFIVERDNKFKVKADPDTSYLCIYE